jgi:hypothetical protein
MDTSRSLRARSVAVSPCQTASEPRALGRYKLDVVLGGEDLSSRGRGTTSVYDTNQGLTLAHCSAQLERFVWDRKCT